jgi:hypothetical protein
LPERPVFVEETGQKPASEAPPSSETTRSRGPGAYLAGPAEGPTDANGGGPSDAELERGILDAVRMGLADVARTLSAQIEERRRARAGNVVALPMRRGAT